MASVLEVATAVDLPFKQFAIGKALPPSALEKRLPQSTFIPQHASTVYFALADPEAGCPAVAPRRVVALGEEP